MNRVDVRGLANSFWDGLQQIGDGLGQLWDEAPGGIGKAVSEGTKGAGEALGKTAEAYATNEDLQKYTGIALGAGAVPIVAAAGAEAAPAIIATAMRTPDKIEKAYDFLSGAFVPGPPNMTPAGRLGGALTYGYDSIMEMMRTKR